MQKFKQASTTEKLFILVVISLVFALGFNIFVGKMSALSPAFADENSVESGEDSGNGEDSVDSEDDEDSVDSVDEESVESVDELSTPSEPSLLEEESVVSVESEPSVVSEVSTESVHSGDNIEDFVNVENLGQNIAVITTQKRLFFLIPVDIDQTVELDEEGNIIDVRQTILNLILDWLSF